MASVISEIPPDRALTAVTEDGSFRVIAARTTRMVQGMLDSQEASGTTAENLADLATGTLLVRLTMAPGYRVQGMLRGAGGHGTLLADCWPDGGCRGLVRQTQGDVTLGTGAMMQVMRTLPNGAMHQGVVEVGSEHGMSGALMNYLVESEQVTAALGVATVMAGKQVLYAGGYVVQLLPECTEPPLAVMYQRLREDFSNLGGVLTQLGGDPDRLIEEILYAMPFQKSLEFTTNYQCRCSYDRVFASLQTVGKADLEDMIQKAEPLAISCDYCRTEYVIQAESLRGLVDAS